MDFINSLPGTLGIGKRRYFRRAAMYFGLFVSQWNLAQVATCPVINSEFIHTNGLGRGSVIRG